jgi:hypothetical protein
MASDSTEWPVLRERLPALVRPRPSAPATGRPARRRSLWLLPALAFLCGGLVSAAVFTIGWRHQAQRNSAAETALAAATARNHRLAASLTAAREAEKRDHRLATRRAAEAKASAAALAQAAASMAAEATAANSAAGSVSSDTRSVTSSAAKLASELKTLTTYLTTTPPGQIDSGYVQSQTAYISRQLGQLQASGANVGSAAASFAAAVQKLARLAASLSN